MLYSHDQGSAFKVTDLSHHMILAELYWLQVAYIILHIFQFSTMVANKVLTLAFIRETSRILLGLKKKGFGEGRWNGFGGKVEPGETIHEAAVR